MRALLPVLALVLTLALAAPWAPGAARAEDAPPRLRLAAPPVPQALALLRAPHGQALRRAGLRAEFTPWRSPEQLRALVASGEVDAAIATLPTAAVLAARGLPCTVLAAYSAPLWIVSATDDGADAAPGAAPDALAAFRALEGEEILLPFGPGNAPGLALGVLAQAAGVRLRMSHAGSALEALNLLRLGRGGHALLPEPFAARATARARHGAALSRRLDLRALWTQVFPGRGPMPTAALVAVGPAAADPVTRAALRGAFAEGLAWAGAEPGAALALADAAYPELGALLRAAGPGRPAAPCTPDTPLSGPGGEAAARFMIERIFDLCPDCLGGRLPGEGFWDMGHAGS